MIKKIEFNYPAFDNVRKCPEVMNLLEETAVSMAQKETGNYEVKSYKKRGAVRIYCADAETERENLKDNRLVKASRRKQK